MNTAKKLMKTPLLIVCSMILLLFSCETDEQEITLYEPGTIDATVSQTSIEAGESVTFTDLSTKVHQRTWSFPGGIPSESSDSIVTVTYKRGGSQSASLSIVYVDNLKESLNFAIEVEGIASPPVEGFGIYSENTGLGDFALGIWEKNNGCNVVVVESAFEGYEAVKIEFTQVDTWGVMASLKSPARGTVNISEYANGYYNVTLKSTSNKFMNLQLRSAGQVAVVALDPAEEPYGFKRDGNWYSLKIPISDFTDNKPALDLTKITDLLVFRSSGTVLASDDWDFYVDHIYLSK